MKDAWVHQLKILITSYIDSQKSTANKSFDFAASYTSFVCLQNKFYLCIVELGDFNAYCPLLYYSSNINQCQCQLKNYISVIINHLILLFGRINRYKFMFRDSMRCKIHHSRIGSRIQIFVAIALLSWQPRCI